MGCKAAGSHIVGTAGTKDGAGVGLPGTAAGSKQFGPSVCINSLVVQAHLTLWQRPQTARVFGWGLCGSGVWVVAVLEGALAAEGVLGLLEVQMMCLFVCLFVHEVLDH